MIGWYADTWFIPHKDESLNCTRKNMEKAVQYHFTTESIMLSRDTLPTISGMTGAQFLKRLRRRINTDPQETGGWPEAPLAYDAIWALALMLNCTLGTSPNGLQQFNYNNTIIAKIMFECMKNIQFRGVSGQVMFSDLGDRIARTQIEQMQDGKYVLLGYYDSSTQTLEWKNKEKFIGKKGPPSDSTRIKQWNIGVDYRYYLVCMNIMVISLVIFSSLLFFNQRFANRRPIIQSQRQCNNLLIIGSALCLFSLVFIGYPGNNNSNNNEEEILGKENNKIINNSTSPFLFSKIIIINLMDLFLLKHINLDLFKKNKQLTITNNNNNNEESSDNGIKLINNLKQSNSPPTPWDSIRTLLTAITNRQAIVVNAIRKISQHSYGNLSSTSIGSKSPIFNRKNNSNLTTNINLLNLPINSSHFYPIIAIIFLIDLTIVLFWFCLDPMKQQKIHFPLQEPPIGTDLDIMLLPVIELCQSQNHDIWIAILLSSKGLLLLLGLFLAYDTKNLKIKYINDLNSTLLSVCNVGILCLLCGTIVIFFLRTQPNPFFCFVSATIYACTFVKEEEEEQLQKQQNNTFNELSINQNEQNRYQQLLKENIELKRQIEMRNIRIQECKRILENQLVLNSPKCKKYISPNKIITNNKLLSKYSNNNNINYSNCLPSTSNGIGINGEILLELDQTTISSIIEPTMITILDQQQEYSTIEIEQQEYKENQEEEEKQLIENKKEEEEEQQLFGNDTGVCSDYDDEDEENNLNNKENNIISSEYLNKYENKEEENEEEIFL
ncbi:G_PROTEIN_RECEP_F3_4 domain-containing protein [Meloidogyne graminicola]|uniref:G_PROTEIN_RECEP_F3_4 domain-containing protein n=1 Tax=Meloidogyne graminicola TaxID=189291 RepID=A0A8S9ZD82_9BILA|nr:G_PROTEIN_RECEP_F3_4 domain-containing protein [Meloidogyne graminicola]